MLREIKNKISLSEKKIRLTKTPHVKNKNTLIMNFAEEKDLISMKSEIENLNLPDATVKHQKKLNSTICLFDVGDIQDTSRSNFWNHRVRTNLNFW